MFYIHQKRKISFLPLHLGKKYVVLIFLLTKINMLYLHFHIFIDGNLVHEQMGKQKTVVTCPEVARELLWAYHSDPMTGGHSGKNNTVDKISRKYYWRGIKEDVVEYVSMFKISWQ